MDSCRVHAFIPWFLSENENFGMGKKIQIWPSFKLKKKNCSICFSFHLSKTQKGFAPSLLPCRSRYIRLVNQGLWVWGPKAANHICQSKRGWCGVTTGGDALTFPGLYMNSISWQDKSESCKQLAYCEQIPFKPSPHRPCVPIVAPFNDHLWPPTHSRHPSEQAVGVD